MTRDDVILLGVDGGGTASRGAIVLPSGAGRIELSGGPANVSDFDGAIERIRDLVSRLLAAVGDLGGAPVAAHLGLAGVMDAAIADRVAAAMPLRRVTVTDDQVTTIAGALDGADGVVAAVGTGSFVGRQSQGNIRCIGGWGFLLGDQASGAWLGRRLLSEVVLVEDGLRPETPLIRRVRDRMGSGVAITAFSLSASPSDFAALAPDIVAAAEADDPVAAALMQEGADYIEAAVTALGCGREAPLCLAGGLGPSYAGWLRRSTTAPRGRALDGALMLAEQIKNIGEKSI